MEKLSHMKKNTSFTLIELLVVIVIIGVLAAVIVVTTTSSVSNATLARAKAFSSNVQNSMLLNLVSEWTFDDSSDYGNDSWGISDANIVGSPQPGENCIFGGCLEFDGTNYLITNDILTYSNGNDFSAEIWFKVGNTENVYMGLLGQNGSGYQGWGIDLQDYSFLRMRIRSEDPDREAVYGTGPSADLGSSQKWHYVVFVNESSKTIRGYLDGAMLNSVDYADDWYRDGQIVIANMAAAMGGDRTNFVGLIDDVRIYDVVLPQAQIKQNYIAGLNSMLANGSILKEEYNQRINSLSEK